MSINRQPVHSKLYYTHYDDVIMNAIASQITSLMIVYSIVYSDADQSKHQSSASLAFVWGIHRDRWIPRTKGQLRGKCFHLMTSSWNLRRRSDPLYISYMVSNRLLNRHALLFKTISRGFIGKLFQLLRILFPKATSHIKCNDKLGKLVKNTYGVLQRGVINPPFFLITHGS